MVKEVRYGVISDIHEDPNVIVPALKALRKAGVDKLIVNGDIGESRGNLEQLQLYTAFILQQIAQTGLETFVQTGSHETLLGYAPVIKHFSKKFRNIVDTTDPKNQKVERGGHYLVFLPGSDFVAGGEYQIGSGRLPTGIHAQLGDNMMTLESLKDYMTLRRAEIDLPTAKITNMNDLAPLVSSPKNTILVCHVPIRFDNGSNGVDEAHFHQQRMYHRDPSDPSKWTYTEMAVMPSTVLIEKIARNQRTLAFRLEDTEEEILDATLKYMARNGVDRGSVFVERKSNRGNVDLGKLCSSLGITKAVSGHFHESSHRAHDSRGNPIPQKTYVNDLFWNSGHLDRGFTGVLTVRGDKVKYENIILKGYEPAST